MWLIVVDRVFLKQNAKFRGDSKRVAIVMR